MNVPIPTLADHVGRRLRSLCGLAGFGGESDDIIATFRSLVEPWANRPLGAQTAWMSDIADDNTPIELSMTLNGRAPEVRVLFETQGDEPTLESFRRAGLRFHARLESEFAADLERFHRVRDLFLPEALQGSFAVWTSVVFARGERPAFKTYFNAQATGPASAPALVEEALDRLGLAAVWPALAETGMRRGPLLDEIKYFALDLSHDRHARAKVYVHHHHATARDLELACGGTGDYGRGEALVFVRAMVGGDERMSTRSPFTCHALTAELDDRIAATTLYVPVCACARDDEVIRARVVSYLADCGIDPAAYDTIIRGFADRPLDAASACRAGWPCGAR